MTERAKMVEPCPKCFTTYAAHRAGCLLNGCPYAAPPPAEPAPFDPMPYPIRRQEQPQAGSASTWPIPAPTPAEPMDWPLPCDVKVGHGTIRKGCSLRTLVKRMQVLYDMATSHQHDGTLSEAASALEARDREIGRLRDESLRVAGERMGDDAFIESITERAEAAEARCKELERELATARSIILLRCPDPMGAIAAIDAAKEKP